ncbi:ABC transporter permease [Ferrovibrio sp.]|uniref:ABC transporter permease n=1 Tax=Ferrovibrio sp. TaxID=1917215 RepID=UPI0035B3E1E3
MRGAAWIIHSTARHWQLLSHLVLRDLRESVAGNALGRLWLYVSPLMTIGIYIFIFAFVFKVKLGDTLNLPYDYTVYILSGLIPWLMTMEVMNRSCMAITGNSGVVKEVVFPIEILPVRTVFSVLANYAVFYVVFFVYILATQHSLLWTHALLPVILALQIIFLVGVALMFSAITAFFRDWARLVNLSAMLLVYAAPIVYVSDWVPELVRPVLYANPISYMVWCFQDALFYGELRHLFAWPVFTVVALLSFIIGSSLFQRLKPMFGNVL